MRASPRPIPLADPNFADSVITLDQFRPGPRATNDYVDSPRAVGAPPIKPHFSSHHHHHSTHTPPLFGGVGSGGGGGDGIGGGGGTSPGIAQRVLPPIRAGSVGGRVGGSSSVLSQPPRSSVVISQQPLSKKPVSNLEKNNSDLEDSGIGIGGGGGRGESDRLNNGDNNLFNDPAGTNHRVGGGGIICEKCSKCQCSDCTETKPLPSHWCCGNVCEVSPEKVLDACTCFCCVKAAMYHFGNEDDYENPCGCCSTSHCVRRWTLMSAMAVCLPCLWAYWPARGCLAACTAAYNRCWLGRKGCDCQCNSSIMKLDPDSNKKSSVLSRNAGGSVGNGGTSGGGGGGGTSKNSQSRRHLLMDSDSSSTST